MDVKKLYIKQHDSLNIICKYADDAELPISLEGIEILAHMKRLSGSLVETFNISIEEPSNGQFILSSKSSTIAAGTYVVDILFKKTSSGRQVASETFSLVVTKAITDPRNEL